MNKDIFIKNIYLHSLANYEPTEFLTSEEIEAKLDPLYKKLNLPFGRLFLQTGIERRGYFSPSVKSSLIAAQSCLASLEKSSLKASEIDALIYCGVCRDYLEPSTSSFIHKFLGLREDVFSFDLSQACLGMMSGLEVAISLITGHLEKYSKVLVCTGENSAPLLHWVLNELNHNEKYNRQNIKPLMANFSIGSMGMSFIVEKAIPNKVSKNLETEIHCGQQYNLKDKSKNYFYQLSDAVQLSATDFAKLCTGSSAGENLMMNTQAEELLKAGIQLTEKTWDKFKNVFPSLQLELIDHLITHQVGRAHEEKLLNLMKAPNEKLFSTYKDYGNTGSAAIFHCLLKLEESYLLKNQENILMCGIGSGIHTSFRCLKYFKDFHFS